MTMIGSSSQSTISVIVEKTANRFSRTPVETRIASPARKNAVAAVPT